MYGALTLTYTTIAEGVQQTADKKRKDATNIKNWSFSHFFRLKQMLLANRNQAAAKRVKVETRVGACSLPDNQSNTRNKFMAVAVKRC
jgi:hypothetical protein